MKPLIPEYTSDPRFSVLCLSTVDLYATDPLKACRLALKLTARLDWRSRLDACDALLGTFGTEGIRGKWQNGYWCDIVASYCNTGDSYALTILCVRDDWENGRFIVSTVGDWVEKNSRRFGII
jgi:hypothetical protein